MVLSKKVLLICLLGLFLSGVFISLAPKHFMIVSLLCMAFFIAPTMPVASAILVVSDRQQGHIGIFAMLFITALGTGVVTFVFGHFVLNNPHAFLCLSFSVLAFGAFLLSLKR